jgi:CBS domain-containing protein
MTIGSILGGKGHDVIAVSADTPISQIAALLSEKRIGAVPVTDGRRVVGILSERDIVRRLASDGASILEEQAADVMTAPAITVTPDVGILTALSLMTNRRIRHLPVVESGRLIGVVSIGDLVKARIERIESEAAAMRDYIQSN